MDAIDKRLYQRSLAPKAIEEMNLESLKLYIQRRLHGREFIPALDPRIDESPSYIIERTFERSRSKTFKRRFERAVSELLSSELFDVSSKSYLYNLLLLCERYRLKEAGIPLAGMIAGEKLKGQEIFGEDLHARALMAFARSPEAGRMRDLWISAITDPRYTSASFAALRSQSLDLVMEYFSLYIDTYIKDPDCLNLPAAIDLLYLAATDDESRERLTNRIRMATRSIPSSTKKLLNAVVHRRMGKSSSNNLNAPQSEEAEMMSVDVDSIYRIGAKLFQAGYREMASSVLFLPTDHAFSEYLLGLLYSATGEHDTAIRYYTSAHGRGLSARDIRRASDILELTGPQDLKHRLFPTVLALADDDDKENLAAAAELIRLLEVGRERPDRAAKWDWSTLQSENKLYFLHRKKL